MHKAIWKDRVLAESADTIMIEGNVYFPPAALNREFFRDSDFHSTCHWKGFCSYYHIEVNGEINENAAWYYHEPLVDASPIVAQQNDKPEDSFSFADYVAFWNGVEVIEGENPQK